jgi:flagellar protein FlgJ
VGLLISVFPGFEKARLSLSHKDFYKAKEIERFAKALQDTDKEKEVGDLESKKRRLRELCHEFEALLIYQMIKSMRETLHKEDDLLYGGEAEDMFREMLDHEYSKAMSKQANFGFATTLYDRMSKYL